MERSVRAVLRAEIGQYEASMGRAAAATERVGAAAQKTSRQTTQAMDRQSAGARGFAQRITRVARDNEQAWNNVRNTLTGATTVMAGMGAVVATTGINYNNLRQVATAALTSITGSTEAATEQMRRLDAYGQNSWLMRDTLIQAQQMMTGFGIETSKVIPYMDALAEATAATGGNNQDFLEMAQIMGQIESQGRITAEELRRFGVRGVDAATLIGDAMGMTAGEIRDEISTGTFDAQTALDALATGMVDTYGGASDLVRNTWRGAVDDIQAAFRDISAIIMSGAVDPEGGGFLVEFLNNVADAMFAVRDLPPWILQTSGAIGALGIAAGGLGTAAMWIVPQYDKFFASLADLTNPVLAGRMRTFTSRLLGITAATAGITAGLVLVANALNNPAMSRDAENLADAFIALADAGEDLAAADLSTVLEQAATMDFGAFEIAKMQAEDLGDVIRRMTDPSVTDQVAHFFGSLMGGIGYMNDYATALSGIDDGLSELVDRGYAELAAQQFAELAEHTDGTDEAILGLLEDMPAFRNALMGLAEGAGLATDDTTLLKLALGELAPEAQEAVNEILGAAEAVDELAEALSEASAGFVDIMGAWDAVIDKNRELAEESAAAAGDAEASWEDFYDGHSVSISDYLDELQAQVDAQREWQANMTVLAGRVSKGTLTELGRLGPEGAPLVAALVDASDEEIARFEDLMAEGSQDASEAFATGLIESIPLIRAAFTSMSDEAIAEMAERLRNGESTIQEELDAWTFDVPAPTIDIDDLPARTGFEELIDDFDNTSTDTGLGVDPREAIADALALMGDWEDTTTDTMLSADPGPAIRVFNEQTGAWEETTTDTLLDLDPSRSILVFDRTTGDWARMRTDTLLGMDPDEAYRRFGITREHIRNSQTNMPVGANPNPAYGDVTALGRWIAGRWYTVNVGANTVSAQRAMSALHTGGTGHHSRVFRHGGYTGDGGAWDPAGIVHKAEFVMPKEQTADPLNRSILEAMHAGNLRAALDGYRSGGMVGTPAYQYRPVFQPAPAPSSSAASGPVTAVLAPEDRALLQSVATRPVQVQMGRRTLAEVTSVAGEYGRARGQGGHR